MILLKFDPELKGDSKVAKHEDWISLDTMNWNAGRKITTSGIGTDRDTSNPEFNEVSITKSMDVASSQLMMEAIQGKSIKKATFHFIQTGGTGADGQHFLEIILENPIVSSYSMGSGGERPDENIRINYTAIAVKYDQFTDGGTVKEGAPQGWDLKANKPKAKI